MDTSNLTTNTPIDQEEDPCGGEYKSTQCVRESNALTEIGTAANATQQEVNQAIQSAIFNLQPETGQTSIKKVKVSLTAAQINNIGTTPIVAIASQGVGTVIDIINAKYKLNWGTVAFDSNTLFLQCVGASAGLGSQNFLPLNILSETSNIFQKGAQAQSQVNNLIPNAAIEVIGKDSVAVGDSTIDIYITYEIITL
jgi:hypothetical protein